MATGHLGNAYGGWKPPLFNKITKSSFDSFDSFSKNLAVYCASDTLRGMSTLSSLSSRDDILAAMADNGSYAEDNDLVKANSFVTACTIWITRFAFVESKTGNGGMTMPVSMIEKLREEAKQWIISQGPSARPKTSGNVVSIGTQNFRDQYHRGAPDGGFGGW